MLLRCRQTLQPLVEREDGLYDPRQRLRAGKPAVRGGRRRPVDGRLRAELAVARRAYEHPAMGPGKRVVADASLMPFADGTFDVALVEEFALRGNDPDEGHTQHEMTWPETYLRSMARNGMRTFWRGRHFPELTASSRVTEAIKQRALDTLRSGRRTRDPLSWIVDPEGLVATQADRDVFIPLRDALDEAARAIRA